MRELYFFMLRTLPQNVSRFCIQHLHKQPGSDLFGITITLIYQQPNIFMFKQYNFESCYVNVFTVIIFSLINRSEKSSLLLLNYLKDYL